MESKKLFILSKLTELEDELRNLELWTRETLTEEQLRSSAPFGCDVMDFHEWLQHMMIPRLKQIIEKGEKVPFKMDTASMAEYVYRDDISKYRRLIVILKTLDRAVKVCL
jgi:uncharacterized protein YqcC (DUF446 family)